MQAQRTDVPQQQSVRTVPQVPGLRDEVVSPGGINRASTLDTEDEGGSSITFQGQEGQRQGQEQGPQQQHNPPVDR
eukprot:9887789-Karenia_brevis.AAC.1